MASPLLCWGVQTVAPPHSRSRSVLRSYAEFKGLMGSPAAAAGPHDAAGSADARAGALSRLGLAVLAAEARGSASPSRSPGSLTPSGGVKGTGARRQLAGTGAGGVLGGVDSPLHRDESSPGPAGAEVVGPLRRPGQVSAWCSRGRCFLRKTLFRHWTVPAALPRHRSVQRGAQSRFELVRNRN